MTGKTLNTDTAVAADAERDTEMAERKITREQIAHYASLRPEYPIQIAWEDLQALCTLALQAEAMQPRPKNDTTADYLEARANTLDDEAFAHNLYQREIKAREATACAAELRLLASQFRTLTSLPEPRR